MHSIGSALWILYHMGYLSLTYLVLLENCLPKNLNNFNKNLKLTIKNEKCRQSRLYIYYLLSFLENS